MVKESDQIAELRPLGRRARKALAVRQALFEAGLAAFERKPIGMVSVLDLTEAADVAKGVFYLQFRSKDDYLLALWEEVQGRILDAMRSAVMDCRSRASRIETAVLELFRFVDNAPAAARFRLRMSSFMPDEIGEPGHLSRIRQEYLQHLASVIAGKKMTKLSSSDLRAAISIDALCWAAIGAALQLGEPVLAERDILKAVRSIIPN